MLGKGFKDNLIENNYRELDFKENYLMKQKEIIENQSLIKNINYKTYSNVDSLVELFHGMLLNYIDLERNNEVVLSDETLELEKIILNYKKPKFDSNYKFKGGSNTNNQVNYIINQTDSVDITYYNYTETNNTLRHYIDIIVGTNNIKINLINETIDDNNNNPLDVYTSDTPFDTINDLIEKIIIHMINLTCTKNNYKIYEKYDLSNRKESINNKNKIYQSVLSLLIIILSFRKDMNKNTYTKYNYTRFLCDMCYNYLNLDTYKFNNNNANVILTYKNIENTYKSNIFNVDFLGDCLLNSLMCVKNENIQRLLIEKKNIIENNINTYNINDSTNYYNKIVYIINTMNKIDLYVGNDYINEMLKYIREYSDFINNLLNYNYWINNNFNNIRYYDNILNNCELFIKYQSAIMSILMDYDNSNELKDYLINSSEDSSIIIKTINFIKNNKNNYTSTINDDFNNNYKNDIERVFKKYYDIINKYNKNLFYINLLISLNLIYCKVDYLFDDTILLFFNYPKIKKFATQRFCNISHHRNEIDQIRYAYLNHNNINYFFSVISMLNNAVVLIVENNENLNNRNLNNKYYICDLNHLNFVVMNTTNNNFNIKGKFYDFGLMRYTYSFYRIARKLISLNKNLTTKMDDTTLLNICMDIQQLYNECVRYSIIDKYDGSCLNKCYCTFLNEYPIFNKMKGIIELWLNNRYGIKNKYDNIFMKNLIINYKDEYKYIYKDFNKNTKEEILNDILLWLNNKTKQSITKRKYKNFKEDINDIVWYKRYTIDNLLYHFINVLYNFIYGYNNDNDKQNFYEKIISGYTNIKTHEINTKNSKKRLLYNNIINVINNLIAGESHKNMFNGGDNIMLDYNNILKKVLIILLIIVIIIIIVLIVLFVINKYKNNLK